ncbi:MAG: hypothetical protein HZA93_23215 [Verrucomicrobia bacterium]|nr:hypothetical protein [Verrucomicrobiota bacterium]
MIVIRRLVDRNRAYTGIFLKGEPPKIFPTTDYEHARILQIYKQDRAYEGILNDFSDYALGSSAAAPATRSRTTTKKKTRRDRTAAGF